jgi:hypothetical protein
MSCQDDLTSVDLDSNVAVQVLERVSAGSGRDENLWGFIDVEKYVHDRGRRKLFHSCTDSKGSFDRSDGPFHSEASPA